MIRNCEDVKTAKDFDKFYQVQRIICIMGLKETAKLILWNSPTIVNPKVFVNLFKI